LEVEMPQVGANNEPLLERAGYVWNGENWVKQPPIYGYTDTYVAYVFNTNLSGGITFLDLPAIPAGNVAVVTAITFRYDGTVPGEVQVVLRVDGGDYIIESNYAVVSARYITVRGNFYLGPGDNVRLTLASATAGDDAYLYATGYKMETG
jgi:hypothetical protein